MNAGNNKSLIRKYLGTYKVIKPIGSYVYRLEVSECTGEHNIAHTTLLKLFSQQDKPQDIDKNKEEIWKVKEIGNTRRVKGVVQYQVQWTGSTELEDTWEMFDHLDNCIEKL